MPKHPLNVEGEMLRLARNHVAARGYPQPDFAMTALVHALQDAIPVPRPVEIHQPGKSEAAQRTRDAALAQSPQPTEPAVDRCFRECAGRPVGWRLYVHEGWQPVCSLHMAGSKAVARVTNAQLAGVAR